MRADLRTCRKLGVTLRRFLGDEPKPGEPEYDDWERAYWRAFEQWEADTCPGCGHQRSESLHDTEKHDAPEFEGAFVECDACKAIELAQDAQRRTDATRQAEIDARFRDNPQLAPRLPSGFRKFFAHVKEVTSG